MFPGGSPVSPESNAQDRMRIYARPVGGSTFVDVADHRYYATYFRLVLGFDTPSGAVAWVHHHSSDFLGGAATQGGVVLCDDRGRVTELDAKTGGVVAESDLGEPVKACVVNVDAFAVAGVPGPVKPLSAQLADAVLAEDAQLVVPQKLLLRELATSEDPSATQALVALVSDPRTSPELTELARSALAHRHNGAPSMLAALERHYDFLKGALRSPPVAPLAQALAGMKTKAAAPLLTAHLLDPADSDEDVRQAAAALAVLAGPSELPSLRQFFGMYRATCAGNEDISDAVVDVARAMLDVGDHIAREQIEAASVDPATVPTVAERLRSLVGTGRSPSPSWRDSGTTPGPAGR